AHHGQQQARFADRPAVLGRLFGRRLSAVDGRAGRRRIGTAGRLSGDRRAGPRQDLDRLRQAGRENRRRLHAAARVRLRSPQEARFCALDLGSSGAIHAPDSEGQTMTPPAASAAVAHREDDMPLSRAENERMANHIRALPTDPVEQAKSCHPGLPMGAADVATVLFTRFLKFDAAGPAWPDRDRFVLSAGHGSMLIYALLHLLGYEKMTIEEIKRFRQLDSITPGHPESFLTPGVETTTGPLGQGLANAVGMAIAERHLAAQFGPELVDHR